MTKKLKKKKQPSINKISNKHASNKYTKSLGNPLISSHKKLNKKLHGNYKKKYEQNQKKIEQSKNNKSYNKKIFNNFAFPDKPTVDYGIINKKKYIVVANENDKGNKNEKYYSKTLFKLNKKGEIKQFFIIQILQDKKTDKFTTYNRKGNFPNYGKAWRYDVYSFNDALLDFYDTVNKYLKEGYEEYSLSELIKEKKEGYINEENDEMEEEKDEEENELSKDENDEDNKEINKEEDKNEKLEKEKKNIEIVEPKNYQKDIHVQNIIVNNKIENNTQIIYPKKKLFISYKKESPKKVVNVNIPIKKRFNVIKEESYENKNNTQINNQNEFDKLKKILNGEAQKEPDKEKIEEDLMNFSNHSEEAFSGGEYNNNEEEDNITEEEEMENNDDLEKVLLNDNLNKKEEKTKKEINENLNDNEIQKPIIKLLKLIFDIKEAKKYLSFLGIDTFSLPISKVTNETYIKALNKLNEIEKMIHLSKSSKFKSKKIFDLSKEYYRIIPHIFHIYHISSFQIDSISKVQKEIENLELIKSVSELEIQFKEILSINNRNPDSPHKIKNREEYNLLLFKKELDSLYYNISVMSHSDKDYKNIKEYLNLYSKESKNNNYPKLILKSIYKLEKKEESIINNSNDQTLLWLGCQIPHFYSILRNGFHLPPKEAPNAPYIYGKGIMLSTNAFEQAQKCGSRNGTGLLLGCMVDVQKADEVNNVTNFELFLKNKRDYSIIRLSRHFYKNIFEKEKKGECFVTYYNYMVYDLSKINICYIAKIKMPNFPLNDKY